MKTALLHKDVQEFIAENYNKALSKIIFKGSPFADVSITDLATQLMGKKKAEHKLPTWFQTHGILYPPSLNIEQTSSEITAKYKAALIDGTSLIDLTGGFGTDSYFFAQKLKKITYCEQNTTLYKLAKHNFEALKVANIETQPGDGIDFLKNSSNHYSWSYLDPSRRNDAGKKVFHLSQCAPNVPEHLDLLFEKSENIMIKTSPLLDLQAGISALKKVSEIHIVAVENEVKELLWILKKGFPDEINIKTINFKKRGNEVYESKFHASPEVIYSPPLTYLYEPNAALMKSGLFAEIASHFNLAKLHPNSHLFTSEVLVEFPGRTFKIGNVLAYNQKKIKAYLNFNKAHIAIRNFPKPVSALRKQFKLKEGGAHYLFFTTTVKNEKIMLHCKKI